jgi:hypothetical protein
MENTAIALLLLAYAFKLRAESDRDYSENISKYALCFLS